MKTNMLPAPLATTVQQVFGAGNESIHQLQARASQLLGDRRTILWEGDAATFQFSYVGTEAEEILGYPRRRWTDEPAFWAQTVVHPEDRDEAIAFCALATGKCEDHDFVYRAIRPDGSVVWLHDIVQVIKGSKGIPERLRGIMIDITHEITQ